MNENILTKIVATKKTWLSNRKQQQELNQFIEQIQPSQRNFYQALQQEKTVYILECKKASPSKGLIRANFQPQQIAQSYAPYASVISVLTDEQYFQGNFDYLTLISQTVRQPVLCKDFIIDSYQVYLARFYQADAILLMLSILSDQQYSQLAQLAHELKMGVLTEVSNQAELERALDLDAKVIGINNRNLRDLTIDLQRTPQLAKQIPEDKIIISESGIANFNNIQQLRPFVNGFLIGSSLMQQTNLDWALRKLLFGTNKVCGLTRQQDALAAYNAGAIYGGLIFATDSPRKINIAQARQIMQQVPQLKYVAVFRQPELKEVINIAQQLQPSAVQLHGDFNQQQINHLRQQLSNDCQIWLALQVKDSKLPSYNWQHIDYYLFDNKLGGSGTSFDWSILQKAEQLDKVILAGGLSPDNCKQALKLGCAGLDFNSGLEVSPGVKDAKLIELAFSYIRNL